MRVESIPLPLDGRSAAGAAAEWLRLRELELPGWDPYPARGGEEIPYGKTRADWLGSSVSRGMLGLIPTEPPYQSTLARVLEGRHARGDGRQVRESGSADDAGLLVTFEVPEWVAALRVQPSSGTQFNIDSAIVASLDPLLEHIRRNTPLIGDQADEFAYGVAACGFVDADRDSPENGRAPRVRAQVLVFGAERGDGSLVAPHASATVSADVVEEASRLARERLGQELVALGYSEEAPRRGRPRTWVGRATAWVHDPFDEYQFLVAGRVERFKDEAALKGEEVAGRTDAELEARRGMVAGAFDDLDHERLAENARWDPWVKGMRAELHRAREDALVLQGRTLEVGSSPNLRAAAEALHEWIGNLESGQPDERIRDLYYTVMGPEARDAHELTPERWDQAVELIAVLREQAIRVEERSGLERERPAGATGIGCGEISEILARQRDRDHELQEELGLLGSARRVTREEIPAPRFLERLGAVIGEHGARAFASRGEPLETWLADQPEDLVVERFAELDGPEAFLDRGAARLALVQEVRAWAGAEPQTPVGEGNPYLRNWFEADADRVLRSLCYAKDVFIREKRAIAQGAERAAVDPLPHLIDEIGPKPSQLVQEWEARARELEAARLGAELDRRSGRDWHALGPEQEHELYERVDRLRAKLGMEPRGPARAIETVVDAPEIDGP